MRTTTTCFLLAMISLGACNSSTQNKVINHQKDTTMTTPDYTTTILVDKTPEEAMKAIQNVSAWWSEGAEGSTEKINDEFTHHYKDVHICKLKLIELVPGKKIVWQVIDNYFQFTKDKTEWIGTKLVFDISQSENKTAVKFTHVGLVPQYECYEICQEAWTNYITNSLRKLITTGKGEPNPKDEEGFNGQLTEKWKQQQ